MKYLLTLLALLSLAASCREDKPATPHGDLHIAVAYTFQNRDVVTDSLIYVNEAGYTLSVSRLQYYISGIRLYKPDNTYITFDKVYYLDLADPDMNHLHLEKVPNGNYTGISFYIGLDSAHNLSNALPATGYNSNMAWPDVMGGGYHFLKLEGHYLDNEGRHGYAVHLGRNPNLVTTNFLPGSFSILGNEAELELGMDISEWFKNPARYDFNADGNYTMSSSAAMQKIAWNGKDVFKIR